MHDRPDLLDRIVELDREVADLRRLCRDAVDFVRFSLVEEVHIERDGETRTVTRDDLCDALKTA